MAGSDFQMRLLLRQNTQLLAKLQIYRRQNEQLTKQNTNLNIAVQNLSDVFAAIAAAWRIMTDSQQSLYALMVKRTDAASKGFINKYALHFHTFEEIIDCLGEKLTNEGHSNTMAQQTQKRISSFVNNYLLFFRQLADGYFRHNDDYLAFLHEKSQQGNLQNMMKKSMNREFELRHKMQQLEPYIQQLKDNLKMHQSQAQHKLQQGIILEKQKIIQQLSTSNQRQSRKLAFMTDYSQQHAQTIIQNDKEFTCYCGAQQLQYYHHAFQQSLKHQHQHQHHMVDERQQITEGQLQQYMELQAEKELLLQRNSQLQAKLEKAKIQSRISEQDILKSTVYHNLRAQFVDLINYTNQLTNRLNKQQQYLIQIERERLEQINQLNNKHKKNTINKALEQSSSNNDHQFLNSFKNSVMKQLQQVKILYKSSGQQAKQRQDKLEQTRQLIKQVNKDNQELHRKLSEMQQKQIKSVQHMEYRHKHFNEVQNVINQMFKNRSSNEQHNKASAQQTNKLKKTWTQYVQYVKTRDKKIKAMQQHIRKKDKQLTHKAKVEQTLKSALAQTEAVYLQAKQKLDKFQHSINKIQKDTLGLSQQCYRLKIQSQQEKNFLNIRLKSQVEVKAQLQEKLRAYQRIQVQLLAGRRKESDVQASYRQFLQGERDKMKSMGLQLKQTKHQNQQLGELVLQKDKALSRLLQEKEKKNLELSKMRSKIRTVEQKNEYQMIRMEMQEYKSKIMCRCGAQRVRQIALMSCPHMFCRKCIDDTTSHRNRKCPICGIKFTKNQIHEIVWA